MPRFSANLSWLYTEFEFTERFAAAARDGFEAVEFMFPYAWPTAELADLLKKNGLQLVLFNAPPGDWEKGERGTAALPGRQAEFRQGIHQALACATALQCPRIHVMAGVVKPGASPAAMHATYVDNLRWACLQAEAAGIGLTIEPINTRDMPGYFLTRQEQAHTVLAEVKSRALQVQMDLYHCQAVEGDLSEKLRRYLPLGGVGHIQIAGAPGRGEPDRGEIRYSVLFDLIDALGYDGWIGCEYRPAAGTSEGLGWMHTARKTDAAPRI